MTAVSSVLVLFGWSAIVLGQDVNLPYVGTGDGASSSNLVLQSAPAGTIEANGRDLMAIVAQHDELFLEVASLRALCAIRTCSLTNVSITNGAVGLPEGTYELLPGSDAIFRCNAGFALRGSAFRTCLTNGSLAPASLPRCEVRTTPPTTQSPTTRQPTSGPSSSPTVLRGLTIDDPVPGRSGCNGLVAFGDAAVSGYYWIWIEFIKLRVYCDMVTDGGGWTLVGRGIGQDVSCWGTDGNCYVGSLSTVYTRDDGSPNPLNGGRTARLSNAYINTLTYTRIRYQGTNWVNSTTSYYWRGKDDTAGGCTYAHTATSGGRCACAANNVAMQGINCGDVHANHRGVGQWFRSDTGGANDQGGCLYSYHVTNGWYVRKNTNCAGDGHVGSRSSHCTASNSGCDVALWVR